MKSWHYSIALSLALAAVPSLANADSTIKTPGDHPHYSVEIEPHGLLGWGVLGWGGFGFGAGVRASIPLMDNGPIPKINNTPAISFGVDFLHYNNCYFDNGFGCGANYLYFPIAFQWNFYVAKRWSVMAEPGIAPYYGFFDDTYCYDANGQRFCRNGPTHFSVTPWFTVGGRFHFNEHVALTMRVGFPTFSIGVSFM